MAHSGQKITNLRTGQVMEFLETRQSTGGALLRIACSSPPTAVKEPEHIHPCQENRYEILSGCLSFSIAGKEIQAAAGEVVAIPPGVPHFFWNGGAEEARYIQEFRPALRSEEFFEGLFSLARAGKLNSAGTASLLQMAAFVPRFWQEIRVTKPPEIMQRVLFTVLAPVSRLLGYERGLP